MSIQPQCVEINYLYANFMEGSIWGGFSSHYGQVSFLLQALKNKSIPWLLPIIARGKNCRLIKSLPSFDRNWKTKFIVVSGFWVGNLMDIGRDPFAPYSRDIGNLHLEGTSLPCFFFLFLLFYFVFVSNLCLLFALQVSNDHL